MKLLHIDSAATSAGSFTRELTAAIVARWQDVVPGLSVTYRDLDAEPLPHLTGPVLSKADPAIAEAGEQTLQQFLDSDVIVLGAPMYNFSVPSTLKAWIDRIALAGRTLNLRLRLAGETATTARGFGCREICLGLLQPHAIVRVIDLDQELSRLDLVVLADVHSVHVAANLGEHGDDVPVYLGVVRRLVRAAVAPFLERPEQEDEGQYPYDRKNDLLSRRRLFWF